MTKEQAVKVSRLLEKIYSLENLHDELLNLESLYDVGDKDLEDEVLSVVKVRLDKALKELNEM